ncbi:hypothetical protein Poli38472_002262 [Pythium oligandrum]|uniref:Sodium-dependent phosphate transporter n=1 Tax=Pythium oligandrum TaxID=41045 RepID=A0A8K1CGW7_PYTOL|nr:hypothetical protein Poli38472_002262 [Pythium oligandrum]|eukprot:TMW63321.1 hypothetical protein Poli38472_002262 [Pythium oligandrum]
MALAATRSNPPTPDVVRSPGQEPNDDLKYVLQEDAEDEDDMKKTTTEKVLWSLFYFILALASLYFFLVAVKLIGEGFTLALGCETKGAFDFADNPIAGLMIGTISTALIHSSSTVTSITVALVGTGGLTIRQGVYVIMGANIGTCVTCIMVAFGQVGDRKQFERAMAAATVHDMYNIWSVIVMFPLEIIAHPLEEISKAMSNAKTDGGAFSSPFDLIVNPLTSKIISVDKSTIYKVASGTVECKDDQSFLKGGVFKGKGLSDGSVGAIVVVMGFLILVVALLSLVHMLSKVFKGPSKRVVSKMLNYNGYINILVGTAITFAVHSSTVVTSTLTPMAGLGVITLEQVYPLVIGANLGTTGTALLASLVTGKSDSVAIALVHFWFNVFGILLFYPIPFTRELVYSWTRALARWSAAWPLSAVLFLVALFLVAPGVLLGLAYMCTASSTGVQVGGWIMVAITIIVFLGGLFWYFKKGGRQQWHAFLERKRSEREAQEAAKNENQSVVSTA